MGGRSGSAASPGVGRKGITALGGSDLGLGEGLMRCWGWREPQAMIRCEQLTNEV